MAVIFLISRIIERDRDLFNLLAFAALVLLLINPAQLWDIGFQLSFAAVAAIVYLAPKWEGFIAHVVGSDRTASIATLDRPRSAWGRIGWWLVMGFGVTLSAQVGYDVNHRMALPSDLPDRTRCGAFYCRNRRVSGQCNIGFGSTRFNLVAPCDAICLY